MTAAYDVKIAEALLPTAEPLQLVDEHGARVDCPGHELPSDEQLVALHRAMVLGRRFDTQATALTTQGSLAVYPSSRGQDACQVGAALALGPKDWLFPTYRDSMALVARGIDPAEVLVLLRGDGHCGYDVHATRTGPQCTPLATNTLHAVGLAYAARLAGDDVAVLALLGDGATSEGDTHEALNVAAVYRAPVVFLVQNNGYAISVPLSRQTAAPTLAHKGIGYGMPGVLIDGNDVAIVHAVVAAALDRARAGGGPTLIEAVTYRLEAHTNADDATRYRLAGEVEDWQTRDPVERSRVHLRAAGLLDDAAEAVTQAEGEEQAAALRAAMQDETKPDPASLFTQVYARPTGLLNEQAERLADELAADA